MCLSICLFVRRIDQKDRSKSYRRISRNWGWVDNGPEKSCFNFGCESQQINNNNNNNPICKAPECQKTSVALNSG